MTIIEDILTVLQNTNEQTVMNFEDIISQVPYIHGSKAQMMAVYRTFKLAIAEDYIVRIDNPSNKRMFVGHMYYRTTKPYEILKKNKKRSVTVVSHSVL